jgi:hypothetical protein
VLDPPPYGYAVDEVLAPPGTGRLRREARRWGLLRRALRDFDVVHLNFGSSLTPAWIPVPAAGSRPLADAYARVLELRDLPLLKRAGKAIFVTFQGGDARQRDWTRAHLEITYATEAAPELDSDAYDARRRWKIARFDRFADRIYALNPDLLHVLPERAEFLPYASVDPRAWRPVPPSSSGPPVLVHAPTDRAIKGTRFVAEAVERLRAEGVAFEYVQLEGLSQEGTRAALERADLLVDQLLAGWYGGLAVEAMALGKPVVCYVREDDLRFLPAELREELPILGARPDTVAGVLREWLTVRRAELPAAGARSRAFAERWHDPRAIAARMQAAYEDALRRPSTPTPQSRSPNSSR